MAQADADEDLNWAVSVDSTVVHAHQHAAGARKRAPAGEPHDRAIGRGRGEVTTKINRAADGWCRLLAFVLTAGWAGDAHALPDVMSRPAYSTAPYPARCRPGREGALLTRGPRAPTRARNPSGHHCPRPTNRVTDFAGAAGAAGAGRPPSFDREVYKQRNTVERCIKTLKRWRGLGEVDSGRPAGVSTSGFPRAASRTRRARLRAPGSPQIPFQDVQFLMP